jgi:small subunit ribosomal protein S21
LSEVRVLPGEHIDAALRRFKKIVQRDGLVADWHRREFFVSPSVARKKKSVAARKRLLKA